jgi:flagellar hook-associated protein 3 FlgL
MRISTSWAQQLSVNSILDQQSKLGYLQMQLSTQKKILAPSDNPAATAFIIDLKEKIKESEQYQNNINSARQRLSLEDGILQSSVNILQRIKELGVQGLNATYSQSDRAAIATEMLELKGALVGLANTRDVNNEYIFSGFKTDTEPFATNGVGGYVYAGDLNQRNIQIDTNRQITDGDQGVSVFGAPSGLAPTDPLQIPGSIANVFEAIDRFAADMSADNPNSASLDDISAAMDNMLTTESSVGVRLNSLDRQDGVHTDGIIGLKAVLSETEDLDFADAISKFTLQTTSLEAAQQAFAKVKNLSLFNYF